VTGRRLRDVQPQAGADGGVQRLTGIERDFSSGAVTLDD